MATTWSSFGPDPPFSSLPAQFQACIQKPSADCDAIIGSTAEPPGFCSENAYKQTTYCACVNNALPCPLYTSTACANSANAYVSSKLSAGLTGCKDQNFCINVVDVGGSQNIVSGITQQCGVIQQTKNIILARPGFAALVFILIVALIIVLVSDAAPDDETAVFWRGLGVEAPPGSAQ